MMIVFLSLIILLGDIPGGSTDECLPNSSGIDQQCFSLIGNKCTTEDDCPIFNTRCDQVCKCNAGMHPSEDKTFCETDIKRIGDSCKDNECDTIDNAVCKQVNVQTQFSATEEWTTVSKCQCKLNHYLWNLKCVKYANDLGESCEDNYDCYKIIGSKKCDKTTNTCQCNEKIYYRADGKCHKKAKSLGENCKNDVGCTKIDNAEYLHDLCYHPSGCKPKFSECPKDRCECGSKYIEYNKVCYGLLTANCSQPSDCLSTSYSCGASGACENVEHQDGEKMSSSKPGVSLYWTSETSQSLGATKGFLAGRDNQFTVYVCRVSKDGLLIPGKLLVNDKKKEIRCDPEYNKEELRLEQFEMLSGSNLKWSNSPITLDKAVYGGANEDKQPYFICRVVHTKGSGQIIVGKLEPPLYNSCIAPYNGKIFSYETFDILVHE